MIELWCSKYMTGGTNKPQSMTEYKGHRVVVTTNDSKMPIIHIGKTLIIP